MDSKQSEQSPQPPRRSQRIKNKLEGRDFSGFYYDPTLNWTQSERDIVSKTINTINKYMPFIKAEKFDNGFVKLPNVPFGPTLHDLRRKSKLGLPTHYSLPLKDGRFWKNQLLYGNAKTGEIRTNHTCLFMGGDYYINNMNLLASNAEKNNLSVTDWHNFVLNLMNNSGIHETVCF